MTRLTTTPPFVSNAMPLPLASGLKTNWKNQAKLAHPQDGPVHGGLTDEHALSARPEFHKRKLGMVTEVSVYW
jgi:hypothetical protein